MTGKQVDKIQGKNLVNSKFLFNQDSFEFDKCG